MWYIILIVLVYALYVLVEWKYGDLINEFIINMREEPK